MISTPSFLDLSRFRYPLDGACSDVFSCCIEFLENDPVFSGHYPNYPILPASLIIDMCFRIMSKKQPGGSVHKEYYIKKSLFFKRIKPKDRILFRVMTSPAGRGKQTIAMGIHLYSEEELCARIQFALYNAKAQKPSGPPVQAVEMGHSMSPHEHLPQRFPLLVVDQVFVHPDKKRSSATKLVSYGDYCYRNIQRHHVKKEELAYPVGGVIEGVEQSAALILAEHWPLSCGEKIFIVGGINGIHIYQAPYPGDVIRFYSTLEYISESNAILSGFARIGDRLVISIDKIFVVMKSR